MNTWDRRREMFIICRPQKSHGHQPQIWCFLLYMFILLSGLLVKGAHGWTLWLHEKWPHFGYTLLGVFLLANGSDAATRSRALFAMLWSWKRNYAFDCFRLGSCAPLRMEVSKTFCQTCFQYASMHPKTTLIPFFSRTTTMMLWNWWQCCETDPVTCSC